MLRHASSEVHTATAAADHRPDEDTDTDIIIIGRPCDAHQSFISLSANTTQLGTRTNCVTVQSQVTNTRAEESQYRFTLPMN